MTEKESSEQVKEITIDAGKVKCSKCNRELRSSCDWVGNHNNILCEDCYQNLAFPSLEKH